MATIAQSQPRSSGPLTWFGQFLKEELAPYPGRAALVAQMTLAATLIMIIGMTFRIPYIWQGAVYALMVSHENTRSTMQSAATIFLVTGIGTTYLLVSMWFVINVPLLHFVWVIGTFFLAFYAVSVLTNYTAAVAFINVIALAIPLWDRHVPAEINVEDTLWLCLAVLVAVVVTGAVELAFVRLRQGDEVVLPVSDRLSAVANLLSCYAEGRTVDRGVEQKVIRFAALGTSLLRRTLRRSDYSPQGSVEMGGIAAVVGRLVDLAETLPQLSFDLSASDRSRFRNLASTVLSIRDDLRNQRIPGLVHFDNNTQLADSVPLLSEMESTAALIPQVFADAPSVRAYTPQLDAPPQQRLLAPDAFVNPDHLRFALKGCLAASICYIIYNAIAWPGISTAVTTCLLTALSTIGSSRQKQVLRITGAMFGGFLIGMGSQIFILPHLDSIAGLVVLFVAVTALSSWFMTSSPRLSYFGIQVALAFYLVNLNEFKIQTSLAVARDRVFGILLGLFIMWLVFDQFWSVSAAVQMTRTFASNMRLLAQFAREPISNDVRNASERSYSLRETIESNFDRVRDLTGGVLLEFGPSRERDLALRERIIRWQAQVRILFLTEIALWKYRAQLPGFDLPTALVTQQRQFDEDFALTMEGMADRLEGRSSKPSRFEDSLAHRQGDAEAYAKAPEQTFSDRDSALLSLRRRIQNLTTSLTQEI
ncbi:MAG TPA: FUSC family protein [Candidatus Sulfotelmatobacter sp.]